MFQKLYRYPAVFARHRSAPYSDDRERYLQHREREGCAEGTLLKIARKLLCVAQELMIGATGIGVEEVNAAANRWGHHQRHRGRARSRRNSRLYFAQVATQWLRFLGRLREPVTETKPFVGLLQDFTSWMEVERGLSRVTVRNRLWYATQFLEWLELQGRHLSAVEATDVDAFLAAGAAKGWSRVSLATGAKALKAFFRHAGMRKWCRPFIADTIDGPRLFAQEALPQGPTWQDVGRLLSSMDTNLPRDIRDRAIVTLFAQYGLRSGEVSRLRLEDIDWERDRIAVRRPKQRLCQTYPLTATVGRAVIRYLLEVRPKCDQREVFTTLRAPFRPLSAGALHRVTSTRMRDLGIHLRHQGPHSLRHACATRLVAEGLSFKEVGDHLGHRSSFATGIYAKVNLPALREVAALDVGGVL